MRIFILAICASLLLTDAFCKQAGPQTAQPTCRCKRFGVEGRVSGQFFITNVLKQVYGSGVNYEVLGTVDLWKGIGLWVAADYFGKKGYSETSHLATRISLIPITGGARYTHRFGCFFPYIGAGLKYYFLHLHNYSSLVIQEISKNAPGLVAEIGCKYCIWKELYLDGFFNYSWVHFTKIGGTRPNIITTDLTLQDINVGAGVGYRF